MQCHLVMDMLHHFRPLARHENENLSRSSVRSYFYDGVYSPWLVCCQSICSWKLNLPTSACQINSGIYCKPGKGSLVSDNTWIAQLVACHQQGQKQMDDGYALAKLVGRRTYQGGTRWIDHCWPNVTTKLLVVALSLTYGAKGKVYVEWKWLMGPFPWPRSVEVLIPASTYLQAYFTARMTLRPFARFDAMAAKRVRIRISLQVHS
jgi:hypothetical protein